MISALIVVAQMTAAQIAAVNGPATYSVGVDSALLRQVAQDAGRPVPDRHLVVLMVPGDGFACGSGRCSGAYIRARVLVGPNEYALADYIFIAELRRGVPWLLRHEYLHFVLGTGDHPMIFTYLGIPEVDR